MNKKELGEIRKQLKYDNDKLMLKGILEAYGKNKDGEASIQFSRSINPDFLELEEGELYFDIFKKSLGGTPGKNLIEYSFDYSDPQAKALQERFLVTKTARCFRKMPLTIWPKNCWSKEITAIQFISWLVFSNTLRQDSMLTMKYSKKIPSSAL